MHPHGVRLHGDTYSRLAPVLQEVHCKKGQRISRPQAGMSLTKLSLAGNYLIIPGQGEFGQ